MKKELEENAAEIQHLSSVTNWKLEESKKILEEKVLELSSLSNELQQVWHIQKLMFFLLWEFLKVDI